MTADVHTDSGYFALVPEWLLDAGVSGNAIKLYAVLARYADQATKYAHPSRRTLAERMGFSRIQSVDPILQQLIDVDAIEVFERHDEAGDRTSNGYVVKRMRPAQQGEGVVRETAPPRTADRTRGSARDRTTGSARNRTTVVRETAQEPEPLEPEPSEPEGGANAPAPSPTCAQHPNGSDRPCRRCGDARRLWDAARSQPAVDATPPPAAPRYDFDVYCEHLQLRTSDCDACAEDIRSALRNDGYTLPAKGAAA